ncbi:uncharacterized protein LOC135818436 [Sycon ciliatum]|uniref:uncharacterized protein LOC135818436 n=1 Tax=Sycon ciliatum TaxID=27933 RepID=UPI0031F601DB
MATDNQIKVLYTHQKTKKWKTWQDGFAKVDKDGKVLLLDESKTVISSFSCPASKLVAGEEFETARYLISVDEVESSQPPPAKKPCVVRPRGPALSRPKHSYSAPAQVEQSQARMPYPPGANCNDANARSYVPDVAPKQRSIPRQLKMLSSQTDAHSSDEPGDVAVMSSRAPEEYRKQPVCLVTSDEKANRTRRSRSPQTVDPTPLSTHRGWSAEQEQPALPSSAMRRNDEIDDSVHHPQYDSIYQHTDNTAIVLDGLQPDDSVAADTSPGRALADVHGAEEYSVAVFPPACEVPINRSANEIIALIRGSGHQSTQAAAV